MKLTKSKFKKIINTIKMRERTRIMAYEILVNGRSSEDVARDFNLTRQAAHKAALRVWREYLKSIDCPNGWTSVELVVPLELLAQFEKIQKELFVKYPVE